MGKVKDQTHGGKYSSLHGTPYVREKNIGEWKGWLGMVKKGVQDYDITISKDQKTKHIMDGFRFLQKENRYYKDLLPPTPTLELNDETIPLQNLYTEDSELEKLKFHEPIKVLETSGFIFPQQISSSDIQEKRSAMLKPEYYRKYVKSQSKRISKDSKKKKKIETSFGYDQHQTYEMGWPHLHVAGTGGWDKEKHGSLWSYRRWCKFRNFIKSNI